MQSNYTDLQTNYTDLPTKYRKLYLDDIAEWQNVKSVRTIRTTVVTYVRTQSLKERSFAGNMVKYEMPVKEPVPDVKPVLIEECHNTDHIIDDKNIIVCTTSSRKKKCEKKQLQVHLK